MTSLLVEISNLTKIFHPAKPPALNNISTQISKGQIIGLAGPDGAGKTTLIRLIAGLLLPSEGTVRVAGYDSVRDAESIHYLTGYMPQKFGLYEDLTVIQNLVLYADLRGVVGEKRVSAFNKLLSFTSLEPFVHRLAGALSGGMKQKLGLACALIQKPALLLLDEPSVGVDPISRRELWKMVQELLKEGISVVWSTAYLDEAERCDSVLLLNEGKLLYSGPPQELTKRVEDRTFMLSHFKENARKTLTQVLRQPGIIDGTIQGKSLRILSKEKTNEPLDRRFIQDHEDIAVSRVSPRFEDAFIDILGGGPGGWSALAEKIPSTTGVEKDVIQAIHLGKKFGNFTAADNISFTIKTGEIFGLLGPNGAGKSTIFKMMCGLLKPTEGDAFINGVNLLNAPAEARAHIGYMAQKFSLYGNLSVRQNLNFFSGIYNVKGAKRQERISEMVDVFDLQPYLNESADDLSLGFKQRLALACSLMHRPEVLFLDEPTSGVDPITRREFWNHINGLVERGVTVMVTTHFMDEAEYCDRIALVYRSQLIAMGTPDELKDRIKSPECPTPTLEQTFIHLIEQYDRR